MPTLLALIKRVGIRRVSALTGFRQSTIRRLRDGVGKRPRNFLGKVRSARRTITLNRLTREGFSTVEARRIRDFGDAGVQQRIDAMRDLVTRLGKGDGDKMAGVRKGMRQSRRSFEENQDSP